MRGKRASQLYWSAQKSSHTTWLPLGVVTLSFLQPWRMHPLRPNCLDCWGWGRELEVGESGLAHCLAAAAAAEQTSPRQPTKGTAPQARPPPTSYQTHTRTMESLQSSRQMAWMVRLEMMAKTANMMTVTTASGARYLP